MDVFLDPAVVEVLAGRHKQIDPRALLLDINARVGLDGGAGVLGLPLPASCTVCPARCRGGVVVR